MSTLLVTTDDINSRYRAASQACNHFGTKLQEVGITLPEALSLRIAAARGWLKPRLRVAIPAAALRSWRTFPEHPMTGDEDCPAEDRWGLEVWTNATCSFDDDNTPVERLWMHWLDDREDTTTVQARQHALDPVRDPEPETFDHPHGGRGMRPWIDFFADWQIYHAAELVKLAQFTVHGVTDSFGSAALVVARHTKGFDARAKALAQRWEERGAFFDIICCYRTILARCCQRRSSTRDVRAGARSFAAQRGIHAAAVKRGINDVLLRLWQRWSDAPPIADRRLMLRLQQDIQYSVSLWSDLSGEAVNPFDPFWYSTNLERDDSARLIDALPHEEWLTRRDFARLAVHYQGDFPQTYLMGEAQFACLLARHWAPRSPLRRFCLAWVRLHRQLQTRDADSRADQTIAANERIEQFNLVGLHSERVLRHVHAQLAKPEPDIKPIVRAAVERSVRRAAKAHLNAAGRRFSELLDRTKLHQQRAAEELTIPSSAVGTGSTAADQLVAAHLNALVLRNYAAHHDYLDDELIYPNGNETKPDAGATLMSSCLLVVVAALHSLPVHEAPQP